MPSIRPPRKPSPPAKPGTVKELDRRVGELTRRVLWLEAIVQEHVTGTKRKRKDGREP